MNEVDVPFISLAPLQGNTTRAFRSVFFRLFGGVDRAYSPFIKTVKDRVSDRHFRDILGEADAAWDLVPQVMGNDPEELAFTSRRLADLGFREVNINMGCPFSMVADKKRGSGLLPHPERIDRMLSGAVPASPIPFSVKLRLGRESVDELPAVLAVLDRYPLSEVILHPRLGVQMYEGRADEDAFAHARSLTKHRLAWNGDILSVADWSRLRSRFPAVRHWMIGRGLLRDPFLAADIKAEAAGTAPPVRAAERAGLLREFHERYFAIYEQKFGKNRQLLDIMKGFWAYLAHSFPDAEIALVRLRRVKDLASYHGFVADLFSSMS